MVAAPSSSRCFSAPSVRIDSGINSEPACPPRGVGGGKGAGVGAKTQFRAGPAATASTVWRGVAAGESWMAGRRAPRWNKREAGARIRRISALDGRVALEQRMSASQGRCGAAGEAVDSLRVGSSPSLSLLWLADANNGSAEGAAPSTSNPGQSVCVPMSVCVCVEREREREYACIRDSRAPSREFRLRLLFQDHLDAIQKKRFLSRCRLKLFLNQFLF